MSKTLQQPAWLISLRGVVWTVLAQDNDCIGGANSSPQLFFYYNLFNFEQFNLSSKLLPLTAKLFPCYIITLQFNYLYAYVYLCESLLNK